MSRVVPGLRTTCMDGCRCPRQREHRPAQRGGIDRGEFVVPYEVKGVVARSKGAPVTVETIIVPDPGPGVAGVGAAINTGGVKRGESVAVFGCGGVGDAAIAGAKLAGATTIIAVDIDDRKLEWARQMGATHTVNSKNTDPVEVIKGHTNGFGVDVAIDAVGHPTVFEQAFYARDLAGRVILVGVPTPDMK